MESDAEKKYYRIDRRKIAFLKFILEGYDGMAILTTMDAESGVVMIRVTRGYEKVFNALIDYLRPDIMIEDYPQNQLSGPL